MTEPDAGQRPKLTLEDLWRWEDNGASWRTVELDDEYAVVELRTCYGEPVDLVRGEEPRLIEFIRARLAEAGKDPAGD